DASGAVVKAATLTGSSTGTAAFTNAGNVIATLAGFSNTGGAFSLTDTTGLTVTGTLDATGQTLTLNAGGGIDASGAVVKAATLTGSSTGTAAFTNAGNVIATLGSFSNTGGAFSLTDTTGLIVTGTLDVTGQTLTLNAGGGIDASGAVVKAATLTGSSAGTAAFTNAGNVIGTLGSFANTGGAFSLKNTTGLSLAGALNAAGQTVTLSAFSITQSSGAITAVTLDTTSTGGGTALTGANHVANATFSSAGTYNLKDLDAVTVGGTTTAGGDVIVDPPSITVGTINAAGSVTLTSDTFINGGAITAGGTIDLQAGTTIAFTGILTAPILTGSAGGATTLNAANQITTLGAFTGTGGAFSLTNATGLTLAGVLNAAGQTVTLNVTGSITQTGGSIAAATLTGSSTGTAAFTSTGNAIANLGAFTNTGGAFSLTDSTALTLVGALNAAGRTVTFDVTGAITQNAGGTIAAATLTGKATGAATFGTHAAPVANLIGTLAAFSAPGGFSLTNNQVLFVSGTDVSSLGVGGVTTADSAILLETTAGDLTLNGAVGAGTATLTLVSAGAITQSGGTLTAGTLTGTSVNATQLGTVGSPLPNAIGTLAAFSGGTGFSFTNSIALNISGADVSALGISGLSAGSGDLALRTAGDLTLATVFAAGTATGSQSITFVSTTGKITQTGGSITTGTLNTASVGDTILGTASSPIANAVGSASFQTTTGNYSLTDTAGLTLLASSAGGDVFIDPPSIDVVAPVSAGGALTLISGSYIQSTAAGTITVGSVAYLDAGTFIDLSGVLQAATLTGIAGGSAHFGTHAAPVNNLIGTLAAFQAGGGFSLTNDQSLIVSGSDVQSLSIAGVDAGTGDLVLETRAGDLTIAGASAGLTAGTATGTQTVALISAGTIAQGAGDGKITAKNLTGASAGATTLVGANEVGALAEFRSGGAFRLTDNRTLDVTGAAVLALGIGAVRTVVGDIVLKTTGGGDLALSGLVDAGSHVLELTSAGLIAQPGGALTAGTLTGSSAGTTTLDRTGNAIVTLGAFDSTGDFSLTNGQALSVDGADVHSLGISGVTSDTGNVAIAVVSGLLTLSGDVTTGTGKTLTLVATNGGISQTGGVLRAATLTGKSSGATSLGTDASPRANAIATLAAFKADGGFSFTDGQALAVSGADVSGLGIAGVTTAGNKILIETTAGGLTLNAAIDAGASTLALASAAAITQTGGTLTAARLTGKSVGGTRLVTHATPLGNAIGTLGSFNSSGSSSLTNAQALAVDGLVDSILPGAAGVHAVGSDILLETTAGGMTLNAVVSADSAKLTLVSAVGITQTGGTLTAGTLTGKSGGATQLGTHAASRPNAIGTLAAFSAPGGFSLTNDPTLAVSGVDVSSLGIAGVTTANTAILLETTTGGMTLNGVVGAGSAKLTLVSTVGIMQSGGTLTAGTLTGKSAGA
ncbi:MAG TPA: hypothetical protein VGC36_15575, partial [Rhizomicrobium sp.]